MSKYEGSVEEYEQRLELVEKEKYSSRIVSRRRKDK